MGNSRLAEIASGPWQAKEALSQLRDLFSGNSSVLLERAIDFSREAHQGQFRADGHQYFIHPIRVALIAAEDSELVGEQRQSAAVIGLLHDTMEDSGVSGVELSREFGAGVARSVAELSTDKVAEHETPDGRRDRKLNKWARLAFAEPLTLVVHAADVCDNTVSWRNLQVGSSEAAKVPRWMMQVRDYQIPLLSRRLPDYANFLAEELKFEESRGFVAGGWGSE